MIPGAILKLGSWSGPYSGDMQVCIKIQLGIDCPPYTFILRLERAFVNMFLENIF